MKKTIGLIGKKATLHVQHTFCTFLCLCFTRLQRETSRNFPVTRFMEERPLTLPLIFTLVAASISHFPTAATKFYVFLPTKKCLLCLLSLPLAVCRSFSRWVSLACRLLSLFVFHTLSVHSKFVDITINLSLIQRGYRNNFRFPFSSLSTF